MIVLNKKRLLFINLSIILSIFVYSITSNKLLETQEVSSTPVSNHTIILDAGHGFPDRTVLVAKMELWKVILIWI